MLFDFAGATGEGLTIITLFAQLCWITLIALPLYLNWVMVQHGWSKNASLVICSLGLVAVVVFLEQVVPRLQSWKKNDGQLSNDLLFTAATLGANIGVTALTELLVLLVLVWVSSTNAGAGIWPVAWPMPVQLICALGVIEFARYWGHRWSHTRGLFWQFHAVHHSASRLSVINLGRIHPGEQLPLVLAVIVIKVLDIPAEVVYWQGAFSSITPIFPAAGKYVSIC